jgi:Helix-turn-helix domain of resolvase.
LRLNIASKVRFRTTGRQTPYKGRKPLATELRQEVVELAANGVTKTQIARQLNIGEASAYRILADNRKG